MNKVKIIIRYSLHILGVAIFNVPGADFLHAQEHVGVLRQWVRCAANVDTFANEIPAVKGSIVESSLCGFALLVHLTPLSCL